eukprot:TRINITY_DN1949_c0_g1_i1.p1 TRINITY_DN1949_c0_g1~~TRINITY_DN1949_c0_g1_i1.p1  ORF type:complete len:523 (-),score=45.03 TRINITY_DN1949_c0_g1_i1:528-1913(-)
MVKLGDNCSLPPALQQLSVKKLKKLDVYLMDVNEQQRGSLQEQSCVQWIEEEKQQYLASSNSVFSNPQWNDPYLPQQWGLNRVGISAHLIDTIQPKNSSQGQNQVKVCIVDSGIDYNHPDLQANRWINAQEIPANGIDDDRNGFIDDLYGYNFNSDYPNGYWNNMDDYFHGTHIAGIIAATVNNAKGIAGVAALDNIYIISCKFTKTVTGQGLVSTGTDIEAVQCIDYCNSVGAHITLSSFGAYHILTKKIQYAVDKSKEMGNLFVAAVGNDMYDMQDSPFYPAAYDSNAVVAVGGINRQDEVEMSNYGQEVDIFAPGIEIISTNTGGGYQYASGSSFAAPFVAGASALILATYAKLGLNIDGQSSVAKHIILISAEKIPSLQSKCKSGGILDVATALKMVPQEQDIKRINSKGSDYVCLPFIDVDGILKEGPCPANGYIIRVINSIHNRKLQKLQSNVSF